VRYTIEKALIRNKNQQTNENIGAGKIKADINEMQ